MQDFPETTASLESAVASFLLGFRAADMDPRSAGFLKMLVKDQLALQLSAAPLPWSREARRFMRKPRPGTSTVVGESATMDAADAAYLNATYGHGFEYDDVSGNGHPGCCVVPTALAVGEEVGATLGQVMDAMMAGYEVYVRLGRLSAPELVNLGWQPHSVLANFGAAAIAARLYGFDAERTGHALGIALSHASGTTEYTASGGSIKRVHAGMAARNGIEAARLAAEGITGPRQWLTGRKGFLRAFIRRDAAPDAAALFAPGHRLLIQDTWFKAYCSCGAHHAYTDAMAQVRHRVDEIVAVDANIQAMTANLGAAPDVVERGVRSIEELQFGLVLQMALSALGLGNGYATHRAWLDGQLSLAADSPVLEFGRRIRLHRSAELDERYPRNFVADVVVHYRDGSSQSIFVEHAKGMPGNPFTPAEHRAKLTELTQGVAGADRLFDLVDRLDPRTPIGDLTGLLRGA